MLDIPAAWAGQVSRCLAHAMSEGPLAALLNGFTPAGPSCRKGQ
jgi:hypothetical protein